MRDFGTKIDNSAPAASGVLTADEDNVRFREDENVVSTSGITLDAAAGPDTDLKMKAQAIARYASGGLFFTDTGGVGNYILSGIEAFIPPKSYFLGMVVNFVPANTNSGPSVITVNGISLVSLYNSRGEALLGGEILEGVITSARYDPDLDAFKLEPWAEFATSYLNNSIYPEVKTDAGVLSVLTPSTGTVEVALGSVIVHRGWRKYSTDAYDTEGRQFATLADKTYHLRWRPSEGFSLEDLSNGTYNPSILPETDANFDTTYDDMLCARIVTDSSNIATVTALLNLSELSAQVKQYGNSDFNGVNNSSKVFVFEYDWGRTPIAFFSPYRATTTTPDDVDFLLTENYITRYKTDVYFRWDYTTELGISAKWTA